MITDGEAGKGTVTSKTAGTGLRSGFLHEATSVKLQPGTGTDLSDEMLEIAKTQLQDLPNVTIVKTGCEQTGFPDSRFEGVFMANLVHILVNPSRVLSESHRILKGKGMIIVIGYTSHGLSFFEKIKLASRYLKVWGKPPKVFKDTHRTSYES